MQCKKIVITLWILLFTLSAVNIRAKTSEFVQESSKITICLSSKSLPDDKNNISCLIGVLQPTITINERVFSPNRYYKENHKPDYTKIGSLLFRFSKKHFSSYCNDRINIPGHVPLYIGYRHLTI